MWSLMHADVLSLQKFINSYKYLRQEQLIYENKREMRKAVKSPQANKEIKIHVNTLLKACASLSKTTFYESSSASSFFLLYDSL